MEGVVKPRGFTLVELLVVLVLAALVAASVAPALRAIEASRERSARSRAAGMLVSAREYACASGSGAGVRYDGATRTLIPLRLSGGSAAPMVGPMGAEADGLDPETDFGVSIEAFDPGADGAGLDAVWSDAGGVPLAGDSGGPSTQLVRDARIELSGADAIVVRMVSGAIQ